MSGLRAMMAFLTPIILLYLLSLSAALELTCGNSTVYQKLSIVPVVLKTPGFDQGRYPSNMTCEFIFQGSNHSARIQIDVDFAEFEEPLFSDCADYISIKDGSTPTAREIVKLCGKSSRTTYLSTFDMVHITFVSDSAVEMRGAQLSVFEFFEPGCGEDWQTKQGFPACFKYHNRTSTWIEAQKTCFYQTSNIMTTSTQQEYDFIIDTYGSDPSIDHPWFGIFDAPTEGTYLSIVHKETLWPPPQPNVLNNKPTKDCVVLDFSIKEGLTHVAESCHARHTFICKKLKDGSTVPLYTPRQSFRRGQLAERIDFTIWILIIIASILLIVLLCIFCKDWMKNRCFPNRVQHDNRLMAGLQEDYRTPVPLAPPRNLVPSQNRARFAPEVTGGLKDSTPPASATNLENLERNNVHAIQPGTTLHPNNHQLPPLIDREPHPTQVVVPVDNVVVHRVEEPVETPVIPVTHKREEVVEEEIELPKRDEQPLNVEALSETEIEERSGPSKELHHSLRHGEGPPRASHTIKESTFISREESFIRARRANELFERPKTKVLDNVSAISLDEFWNATKK